MGFGTTFSMLAFLFIFAGMSMFVISVQESLSVSANAIKEQNTQTVAAQNQEITITATSTATNQELNWITTYDEEFEEGNFSGTATTNGDAVELSTPGDTYQSSIYDTGYNSNYTTITYNAVGASEYRIRSGASIAAVQAATYFGPDATPATSYSTGQQINETHNSDRYIQYEITHAAATETINDVTIGVRRITDTATVQLENTGSEKLRPEETNVYIDGMRITRDETARILSLEQGSDLRLWNPGEELNITIFTPSSVTLTINNEQAQDEVSV